MNVRYIGDYYKVSLIKGTTYHVVGVEKSWYRIVDETGEDYLFPPEEFEVVEEETNVTSAPSWPVMVNLSHLQSFEFHSTSMTNSLSPDCPSSALCYS
ncbi:MAG: hypothetical protein LBI64_03090 [Coriobacteriales bacterium]|jgi:hypothetical protein|nr:hypothetical protein [Coriobacteriales bacterium]